MPRAVPQNSCGARRSEAEFIRHASEDGEAGMSRDEFVRMLVAESIPLHDDFLDATFPERDSTIVRLHSPTHRRFERFNG